MQSLPSWEKEFIREVGSLSWKRFVEAKRHVCMHDSVIQWDDSAGEQAFRSAKHRFWAQKNGISCEIPPPDPDMYIDSIDWNSKIDGDLLVGINSDDEEEEADEESLFGNPSIQLKEIPPPTGWDVENRNPSLTGLIVGD